MNLRDIANAAIQSVNPDQIITWKRSTGDSVDEHFNPVPAYESYTVKANIQAAGSGALQHINGLNQMQVKRTVFMSCNAMGVSFRNVRGGDILVFPEFNDEGATSWKVDEVVEAWDDWAKVIVVQQ